MSLREQADQDLGFILNDSCGFTWPITLTDPDGNIANLAGVSDDIAQLIDPDTGEAVSGRLASACLRIQEIYDAGLTLPRGVSSRASRPWLVQFDDINGLPYTFKVSRSNPDRMLGEITLILEAYTSG